MPKSQWPSLKSLQILNVGEDVEKREPSYTVDGNVNRENSMEVSQKAKKKVAM